MQKTDIEYLTHTWNPIAMRCSETSSGCRSCWHLKMANRLSKNPLLPVAERLALAGGNPFVLRTHKLADPMKTKKPAVIGVQFMGDLFHEDVPFSFIDEVFQIIGFGAIHHKFLILSKRPRRMAEYFKRLQSVASHPLNPFPNVYSGLTVCNQQEWGEKGELFLQIPGKKFISHEPALEQINYGEGLKQIAGLIAGAETGVKARPSHPDTFRSDRDQCKAAGADFFFKSWGEYILWEDMPSHLADGRKHINVKGGEKYRSVGDYARVGKKNAGRMLDGRTHDDLPWVKP